MGKRNNTIIISGILVAFLVGAITANPVVEAAGGWKGAFDDLINGITAVDLNSASTIGGSPISTAPPLTTYPVRSLKSVTPGSTGTILVSCLSGDKLLSGGYGTDLSTTWVIDANIAQIIGGFPPTLSGIWIVSATNTGSVTGTLSSTIICADLTP